jgi:hypothetical protein
MTLATKLNTQRGTVMTNHPDPLAHDSIFFTSHIADGVGVVQWRQGQYTGLWEPAAAIKIGSAILLVAGISLAEGTIAVALLNGQQLTPGTPEYLQELSNILQVIRSTRVEIEDCLRPVFGYLSQQPLVEIGLYKTARTVTIDGALEEAAIIIEVANAAIVDGLLEAALTKAGVKGKLQERVFANLRSGRNGPDSSA